MAKLHDLGLYEKAEPYTNNVGYSERADVPIEPRLSEQWFLKYPAVEKSKACVEQELGSAPAPGAGASALAGDSGGAARSDAFGKSARPGAADGASAAAPEAGALPKMRFHPQRWAKVYDHWLTNIQDWCISRQLWWGHRIPVWSGWANEKETYFIEDVVPKWDKTAVENGEVFFGMTPAQKPNDPWLWWQRCVRKENGKWFISRCIEPGYPELEEEAEKAGLVQDPDVLDTWFSSWLWPFATMGWPEPTETLKKFYPTTDLVTGPDIIFFWVARMIMAGYEFMGELPFQNVYFTGIIRDKQGRKMSKTLGNSPDPLVLIAQYGADALRFGTMRSAPLGQDVLFDEKDVELGRNFCNKLWNACRFRQMQGGGGSATSQIQGEIERTLLTSDDKWILLKLDAAIREVTVALNEYKFSEATSALYRFFWNEYCDWYVEASKAAFFGEDVNLKANKLAVIDFILSNTIRMFHPFLPFITEELWHGMGYSKELPENQGGKTIMFAAWPKPFSAEEKEYFTLDDTADKIAAAKYELVSLGRNLRRELKLDPAKKLKFILKPAGNLAVAEVEVLKILLNAEAVEVVAKDWSPAKGTPSASNALGEIFLPLDGLIDLGAEKVRLTKEAEKIQSEIVKVEQKLANPNFTQKVPATVLDEHRHRLADWQAKLAQVQNSLAALG
jgi:valyl-tRNA synthetase